MSATEVESRWFTGAGGSWAYEVEGSGTRWTQTNTLVLKPGLLGALLRPIVAWYLGLTTRRAMRKAKTLIEGMKC